MSSSRSTAPDDTPSKNVASTTRSENEKGTTGSSSSSSATSLSSCSSGPLILSDPRFRAGRKLIETGRSNEGAIEMFATLLEEARSKYGEASIEASSAYFEYGNALFRGFMMTNNDDDDDADDDDDVDEEEEETAVTDESTDDKKPAAAAATQQQQQQQPEKQVSAVVDNTTTPSADTKQAPAVVVAETVESSASTTTSSKTDVAEEEEETIKKENNQEAAAAEDANDPEEIEEENDDDVELALEMMETAWSILDVYIQSSSQKQYHQWAIVEQIPRVLLGIGDVLTQLERHADAADTYSKALAMREANLERHEKNNKSKNVRIEELKDHRKLVEANILVAEALLACPDGKDVITSETKDCLVTASERIDYARGYYDKARDALQETVFVMGEMAASKTISSTLLETEKENVCFTATMVMGVGTTLAEYDEQQQQQKQQQEQEEPVKKKMKTI